MKNIFKISFMLLLPILISCKKTDNSNKTNTPPTDDLYFEFTIDGEKQTIATDNVLTTYNEFGEKKEFKIFAGSDDNVSLLLTIPNDMTKTSSTPSGNDSAGNSISQGSVSLQNYPSKEYTFNSFDFLMNPTPAITQDAIVVTEITNSGDYRIITGTINVTVLAGDNGGGDPNIKDRKIVGKFKVKHKF